jgi:hypothetical protein
MEPTRRVVKTHGQRQLEVRLEYPIGPDRSGHSHHRLDLYVFTPHQLAITEARYSVGEFFGDLLSRTRHRVPGLRLTDLLDEHCALSPLVRLREHLSNWEKHRPSEQDVVYELKTLANIHHARAREGRHLVRDMLQRRSHPAAEAERAAAGILEELVRVREAFAELDEHFLRPGVSDQMKTAARFVDEFTSIHTERTAIRLYELLEPCAEAARATRDRCREVARSEREHRFAHSYPSCIEGGDARSRERFLFREHELKKWGESAMHMTVEESRAVRRVLQLAFGIAAAVAMGFAVVASVLANKWLQASTLYTALIAVIAYIFKDRMKEGLRSLFQRAVPRWIADRIRRVVDPRTGKTCGQSKERVGHIDQAALPSEVRRIRYLHTDRFRDLARKETVLHYSKSIRLDNRRLMAGHERLSALMEVLRLNMARWFERMDKSEQTLAYFDSDGELQHAEAQRTYHIALVLAFSHDAKEAPDLYRYRIVARREGILRVEEIDISEG